MPDFNLELARIETIRACANIMRSTIGTDAKVLYASTPVTTGRRMYELLRRHSVKTMAELKNIDLSLPFEAIIKPNLADGVAFARRLRSTASKYVISPADFNPQGWSQGHFMALWKVVIDEHSHVVCFQSDWQYSNGCIQELAIALERGLELRLADGETLLDRRRAADLVAKAIYRLERDHFDVSTLVEAYRRIELHLTSPRPR